MLKIKNYTYLILGFIIGIFFAVGSSYAAIQPGTLGKLFNFISGPTLENTHPVSNTYRLFGENIQDDTITTHEIKNGTILGKDLASGVITSKHIKLGEITSENIEDKTIETRHITNTFVAPNSQKIGGKIVGMNIPFPMNDSYSGFVESRYNRNKIPTSYSVQKYVYDIWKNVIDKQVGYKAPKMLGTCTGENRNVQWDGRKFVCSELQLKKSCDTSSFYGYQRWQGQNGWGDCIPEGCFFKKCVDYYSGSGHGWCEEYTTVRVPNGDTTTKTLHSHCGDWLNSSTTNRSCRKYTGPEIWKCISGDMRLLKSAPYTIIRYYK